MSVTYEDWLKSRGTSLTNKRDEDVKYYNDLYNATENTINTQYEGDITYAEGVRKNAEAAAATGLSDANAAADERLRGSIAQADDTFERDKVTYGQAAERLAQAGLTGSGFSDNLTRDAFASRAALYADANRTNAAEKHAAEVTYRDAMAKAASDEAEAKHLATSARESSLATAAQDRDEAIHLTESDYEADMLALEGEKVKYGEEKAKNLETVVSGIKNGEYNADDIARLAEAHDFSETEVEWLNQALSDRRALVAQTIVTGIKNGEYNADDIARLAKAYDFSETEVEWLNQALSDRQALVAQTITNEIRKSFTPDENGNVSPAYTLADIDALVTAGEITGDHARALKDHQNGIVKNMFAELDRACRTLKRDSEEGKAKNQEFLDALKEVETLAKNGYIEMQTYYECLYDIYNPWVMEWSNPEAYASTQAAATTVEQNIKKKQAKSKAYQSRGLVRK